jgi:hypothetical protein
MKFPLVHWHLTCSGLVWILSLWGQQEQSPFTTRLRGLKLDKRLCLVIPASLAHIGPPHAPNFASEGKWLCIFRRKINILCAVADPARYDGSRGP